MTPSRWRVQSAWLGGPDLTLDVAIEVADGVITAVDTSPSVDAVPLPGVALPGLVNAHSHAFHRLLRGRTHRQGGDFWVWRESMYETAERLDPDSYEEIATAVFTEMALAGVTAVGEFHYLHHQDGGLPYDDGNEMGHAVIRAARSAGIRIALLDVGYFRTGFGDEPLSRTQQRFSDGTVDQWLERASALADAYKDAPDVVIGLAPHSVRAVSPSDLERVAKAAPPDTPVHIHVSEQVAENTACMEATGLTPIGVLEEAGMLGPDTTLVHATHLTDADIAAIGDASSSVCYCATTERDLADGMGPAAVLAAHGAQLCVGSDSHAIVDIFGEIRGMEMHQRLATGHRGVIGPVELAMAATASGTSALGFSPSTIAVGAPADFITVDVESPRLAGMSLDGPVDQVVFGASAADVADVFVGGQRIVSRGQHHLWEGIRTHLHPDT